MPDKVDVNLTRIELTLKTSALVNLDALGIRVEDVAKFFDLRMRDWQQFEVLTVTRATDKMLKDAIESAIRERHHRLYPGYVSVDTENGGTVETAKWILTAAKTIRRISCSFIPYWVSKIL
jgi:hypothetical protein